MELKFSKKALKKSLSVVLAIMILVSCMSQGFSGMAAEIKKLYPENDWTYVTPGDYVTSGNCNDGLSWRIETSNYYNYTLYIYGTGAMDDYFVSGYPYHGNRPWEDFVDSIDTVVIEDGVASIGEYAFYDYDDLDKVIMADTVKFIGAYAFASSDIGYIKMSDNLKLIGDSAFASCYYLHSISLPDGLVSIGDYAFRYCENLISITIPDSVTTVGSGIFSYCYSLYDVTLSKNIKYLGNYDDYYEGFFEGCSSLKSITIPNGVTYIDVNTFSGCTSLEDVVLPDNITSIKEQAFYNCVSLKNITLPNQLKTIGYNAFYNCTNLKNVIIPDEVTEIGYNAFYNCSKLESIHLGKSLETHVIGYDYGLLYGCTSLSNITVDEDNKNYSIDEFGVLFNKDKSELLRYPAGNTRTNYAIPEAVSTIGVGAFSSAKHLTSIDIPDNVESLGFNSFENCSGLTNIDISNKIYYIPESTFEGCISLYSISIPNSVHAIDEYAFKDCLELKDVYYDDLENNWNNIEINEHNEWLLIANKHFAKEHNHRYSYHYNKDDCVGANKCICGDEETFVEHRYNNFWSTASCGQQYRYCYYCNKLEYATSESVVHRWNDWIESSCGFKYRYCIDCDIREYDNLEDVEHNLSEWTSYSGKCGQAGQEYRYCENCDYEEYRDVDAIEHYYRYEHVSGVCGGIIKYRRWCKNCDFQDYYEVEKKHEYVERKIEPTCTNAGKVIEYCKNCGADRTETSIPATGHDYTTYTISVVSCETDGVILNVCSVCEDIEIESTPKTGHNIIDGVCVNCSGNTSSGTICANGHSYTWETLVATSCNKEGVDLGTCSVCEGLAVEYNEATGHDYKAVVTAPTCTAQGYTTYTCNCGDSYIDDYVSATGHNMNNGACENCDYTENVENNENNNTENNENDNDVITPSDDCSCNCHKSGISNFFFKFALFFQKIFGSNKECACGVAHY